MGSGHTCLCNFPYILATLLSRMQTRQQGHYYCGTSAHIKTQRNSPSHHYLPMTNEYQRSLILKKCSATLPTPHFCSLLGILSPTHPMPSPLEQSHPRPSHAWRTPPQRLRRLHHLGWLGCLVVVLLVVMGFEGTAPKQQLPPSTSAIGGSKEAQLLSQASCGGN